MKKEKSGALFKNQKKNNDNSPDLTGNLMIDGKDYKLAGWNNTSKSGLKYISLRASIKEEGQRYDYQKQQQQDEQQQQNTELFDQDIPF